jgi:hypothetical protein
MNIDMDTGMNTNMDVYMDMDNNGLHIAASEITVLWYNIVPTYVKKNDKN